MKRIFYIVLILSICCPKVIFAQDQEDILFSPKKIPVMYIELSDGKKLDDIVREVKSFGVMRIENANGSDYAAENLYYGGIRIKGRGNSSWDRSDKKSYSIDLINSAGKKNEIPLLGMAKNEDWILHACYFDKTFLRHYFAFYLANAMGNWAPHLWFVELYVNDEYRGLYMLCENIKKGKQRVNVKDIGNEGDALTGGYLIEQDYPHALKDEGAKYITSSRIYPDRYYGEEQEPDYLYFGFKYPKDDDRTPEQTKYISDYIADFETALYDANFKNPVAGYRKYVDVQSFVDWYVMEELAIDWDHSYFLSSVFFHKQQGEKLKIGPIWDFDVAYKATWAMERFFVRENMPWINRMWEDEEFQKAVARRFIEVIPIFEKVLARFEDAASELNRYGAVDRNFERWPILGEPIWTDTTEPIPDNYEGELRRLVQWIRERFMYIAYRIQPSTDYCMVLSKLKPMISILDQNKFENGELPLEVQTGYLSRANVKYLWNEEEQLSQQYTINSYGTYSVTLTSTGCESLPSDMLYVKPKADIIFSGKEHVYDGKQKSIIVSTLPAGLSVKVTYNGSSAGPVEPGSYRVVAVIDDMTYKGQQSVFLTIAKISQTINFEIPKSTDILGEGVALRASSSSDLPVSFRVITGNATIDNNVLTFGETGAVVVEAYQNGDYHYSAAEPIRRTIDMNQLTGVSEISDIPQVKVYPNPATDQINITFDEPGHYEIKMSDASGKVLIDRTTSDALVRINVGTYPQGVYILHIKNKNNKKYLIQKVSISR